MIAHAPSKQMTWQTYEQFTCLFAKDTYAQTHFPTRGPLPLHGLTTAGKAQGTYDTVEVFGQDASIMGFGYGNTVSSPRNVARFVFDLLGPGHKFVSKTSLAAMQKFHPLDTGWAKGAMVYGAGLEIRNVAAQHDNPPKTSELATFVGHDGVTFGFFSNQGWFPRLETAMALMTNQENDDHVNYAITCRIVKIVAKHRGIAPDHLLCPDLPAHGIVGHLMQIFV